MADALQGQGKREQDEAKRLQATAEHVGAHALGATTLAAAQAAIRAVQGNESGTATGEAIADLRKLRTDAKLLVALEEDLRVAELAAFILITDAVWMGYKTAVEGRADLMGGPLLEITFELTDADRELLRNYPILGHTPREVSTSLEQKLSYEVDGALAMPLTGTIDAELVPAQISAVGQAHGQRLSGAVGEAYFAGVQAAVRDLGAALVGR